MDEQIRQAERSGDPNSQMLKCRIGEHAWESNYGWLNTYYRDGKSYTVSLRLCIACHQVDFPVKVEDIPKPGVTGAVTIVPGMSYTTISSKASTFPVVGTPTAFDGYFTDY